jgi:uncharacterized circularly permuted ATP-grasp superfamily protein/uncharacterized alpha-E superfamily protein
MKASQSQSQSAAPAPLATPLFASYEPLPAIYDESVTALGNSRPHWQRFARGFDQLGPDELTARWENARKFIRENGVTYNVYGDPMGMDRPWELDMLPLLISAEEWRKIEAGLVQRTKLLNCILKDIYGPQKLLRSGLLPPALLFGNPGFLRSCHGIEPPEEIFLHLHAVDLARSPDGQWWALADRTQAPSGAGYALENRLVLSRILPDEFRDSNVHRLAGFFAVLRDTLRSLAKKNRPNPNVVLLTPGPHNETYFEHSYLARYLGFTLVEGADLTVRDRTVFIKTLEGLQQVDVIFRRVDDVFCDPLELRNDSFLGVAGLVEAARAGNVAIANALGASILESPAFHAFLPSLCQHLLDEELKLPSVATWWCGQAKEQKLVLECLGQMVVKSAFAGVSSLPFFGRDMTEDERDDLINAIKARPFEFVGQQQVSYSTAPSWIQNKLEPRGVVLRAFVAANGKSHVAMPGGLTRVSNAAGSPVVTMQTGGGSKDTWILSEGPVPAITLLNPSTHTPSSTEAAGELTSRVADNLYWLGRYAERLESALRLLRAILTRMSSEAAADNPGELQKLIELVAKLGRIPERFTTRIPLKELEHELLQLVYSARRGGSVRELVLRIRHVTSMVRDRFSNDTWRILNQLQTDSRTRPGRLPLANALALLNTLIADLAAFAGMEMENMTRGHGWRFLDFGRRLERAANLLEVTEAAIQIDPEATSILPTLLELADSSMTYRRRYFAQPRLGPVLHLLLADQTNPRSLTFQIQALQDHIIYLPRDNSTHVPHLDGQLLAAIAAKARNAEIHYSNQQWLLGKDEALRHWLKSCVTDLAELSDNLTHQYFSLTGSLGS